MEQMSSRDCVLKGGYTFFKASLKRRLTLKLENKYLIEKAWDNQLENKLQSEGQVLNAQ